MNNFRTYQMAVEFYKNTKTLNLCAHLKDQLSRASSSIALNLAEGSGRTGSKDQNRFFQIAMASLRECQAILDLTEAENSDLRILADKLGASLFNLIKFHRS